MVVRDARRQSDRIRQCAVCSPSVISLAATSAGSIAATRSARASSIRPSRFSAHKDSRVVLHRVEAERAQEHLATEAHRGGRAGGGEERVAGVVVGDHEVSGGHGHFGARKAPGAVRAAISLRSAGVHAGLLIGRSLPSSGSVGVS